MLETAWRVQASMKFQGTGLCRQKQRHQFQGYSGISEACGRQVLSRQGFMCDLECSNHQHEMCKQEQIGFGYGPPGLQGDEIIM